MKSVLCTTSHLPLRQHRRRKGGVLLPVSCSLTRSHAVKEFALPRRTGSCKIQEHQCHIVIFFGHLKRTVDTRDKGLHGRLSVVNIACPNSGTGGCQRFRRLDRGRHARLYVSGLLGLPRENSTMRIVILSAFRLGAGLFPDCPYPTLNTQGDILGATVSNGAVPSVSCQWAMGA